VSEVRPESPPFLELYAAGNVAAEDIDDFIDAWHESDAKEKRTLAQFLGMTEDEYTVWLASRKALPMIAAAQREGRALTDVVAEHLDDLRHNGRSVDQTAIRVLSNWLSRRVEKL
jgi:hypothetical protein